MHSEFGLSAEWSIPDRDAKVLPRIRGRLTYGASKGGRHLADLGGVPQCPILSCLFYPSRKCRIKMISKKFPLPLGVERHVASQNGHLWWAPPLKLLPCGVSFQNLVRLAPCYLESLGILPLWIKSQGLPTVLFHFVFCFSKLSRSSQSRGSDISVGSFFSRDYATSSLRQLRLGSYLLCDPLQGSSLFLSVFFLPAYHWW